MLVKTGFEGYMDMVVPIFASVCLHACTETQKVLRSSLFQPACFGFFVPSANVAVMGTEADREKLTNVRTRSPAQLNKHSKEECA